MRGYKWWVSLFRSLPGSQQLAFPGTRAQLLIIHIPANTPAAPAVGPGVQDPGATGQLSVTSPGRGWTVSVGTGGLAKAHSIPFIIPINRLPAL